MNTETGQSMVEGSAAIIVAAPPSEVFDAVADISRMGEWSPECVAGRWIPPSTEPAVGAEFEGDNVAKIGPITIKKWTTTSKITECVRGEVFEFVAEGYSTWRYEFAEHSEGTQLTESFSYPPYTGVQNFLYETVARRSKSIAGGVEATLARIKSGVEGAS